MILKRITVFRALQLGDLLCAVPAIRALKKAFPQAEITLLGLPWAESFVKRFSSCFSGFIAFPGFPGLPEQYFDTNKFTRFLADIKRREPDLLIQLHGNGSVINPLMKMMSSGLIAGYFQAGGYCPDARLFMPYPEGIPEIKRHLKLMEFLNIPPAGEDLEFPVSLEEELEYQELLQEAGLSPGSYVCIHAGARDRKRRWEPEKFARVADSLAEKGYTAVLTGTLAEKEITARVSGNMQAKAVDLSGKTSLGALAALIRDAALLISNDTGVSHIAAAMQTPSVIIFLTSDPARWAPLNRASHRIILPEESDQINIALFNAEEVLKIKKERIKNEL